MSCNDYFYKCPECDEVIKLENIGIGERHIPDKVHNDLIRALEPIFNGEGKGVPIGVIINVWKAIEGYKYPERYEEDG